MSRRTSGLIPVFGCYEYVYKEHSHAGFWTCPSFSLPAFHRIPTVLGFLGFPCSRTLPTAPLFFLLHRFQCHNSLVGLRLFIWFCYTYFPCVLVLKFSSEYSARLKNDAALPPLFRESKPQTCIFKIIFSSKFL